MRRTKDGVEQLKEDILNVACEIFARKGYHETKMDDIAEALDISRGPLYYHYKNKSALFTAAVELHMTGMLEDIRNIFESDAPLAEKIEEDFIHRVENISLGNCIKVAILSQKAFLADANQTYEDALGLMYKIKLHAAYDAQKNGELRPGVSPEDVVSTIFILYGGLRNLSVDFPIFKEIGAIDKIPSVDNVIKKMMDFIKSRLLY